MLEDNTNTHAPLLTNLLCFIIMKQPDVMLWLCERFREEWSRNAGLVRRDWTETLSFFIVPALNSTALYSPAPPCFRPAYATKRS